MKKKTRRFLAAFLVFLLSGILLCGFDSQGQKVYDDAGLLSQEEQEELQDMLVAAAEDAEQDMIVVTTADSGGKSPQSYADDFYDSHGFGYEKENGSGVLLLIDMDNREIYISTAGTAIEEYTDAEIEDTLDAVIGSVQSEEYGEACRIFAAEARTALMGGDSAVNGYYDQEEGRFVTREEVPEWKEALAPEKLLLYFVTAFILAAVIVFIIARKRKTRMTVTGRTYLKDGSLDFHLRSDRYINTTVVKRHIPQNNGGGGGGRSSGGGFSSSHTSSGGHSHGGGGRSF